MPRSLHGSHQGIWSRPGKGEQGLSLLGRKRRAERTERVRLLALSDLAYGLILLQVAFWSGCCEGGKLS